MKSHFQQSADGLYATWSGHRHPLAPRSPVSFDELTKLEVFYVAEFEGQGSDRRLAVFDKFRLTKRGVPDPLRAVTRGTAYSALEVADNEFRVGSPVSSREALRLGRWVVAGVEEGEATLVQAYRVSSTRYKYGLDGQVSAVTINDSLGERVIRP